MQSDGNLVVYLNESVRRALWATNTAGNPGAYAVMQGDGNFVVYSSSGAALWNSGTQNHPGAYVVLQDDANLVVVSSGGVPLWSSGSVNAYLYGQEYLNPGDYLTSPNRQFQFIMQTDGNLVLYTWPANGVALWSSQTAGNVGAFAIMQQTDGNLVVYNSSGLTALWSSGTAGHPGANAAVQDDGNVVIYGPGALTTTGTQLCSSAGVNNCNRTTFSEAEEGRLQGIGAPVTSANVSAMVAWAGAEGTVAICNPLATTQPEPGSWDFNSSHVKNYQDFNGHTCWYWGVTATLQTLKNGLYPDVLNVLYNPTPDFHTQCLNLAQAVGKDNWGTNPNNFQC
jgi:hypothetical protein